MDDTVLVTGASSQLGVFLLPRLQQAGFRVLAISRKAPASPLDRSDSVRWLRPGQQLGRESGPVRHLVSCGPLNLVCELLPGCPGLQRVVAFSTSSVITKAGSENPAESQLMARITTEERRLKVWCETHGIALTLIRPTLIYGCGLDRNISLLARFGRRFGFIPLSSAALGLRQPVHADDLAELAVRCLLRETAPELESAAGGGSTLSYREMIEKTAAACGPGVRTLALSSWMLRLAVRLVSLWPGLKGLNPEMVERQARDMTFDDSRLRASLGYEPRAFEPAAGDFEIPGFARDLQLPG